jgi:RNA polymerase sigma factor (sigma-70 family)
MTDADLLTQWTAQRDARAFHEISGRYAAMVYATCCRVLRNPSDAEDLTQECFEVLARTEQQPSRNLGAWLHAVAVNRCLNHLKSGARRRDRETTYAEEAESSSTIAWSDVYEHVDQAVQELPDELREPLVAHYLHGESHAAIARQTGIPRRTVSNRIARGVAEVADKLKGRGMTTTGATLGALFADNLAQAEAVPAALSESLGKLALSQGGTVGAAATGGGALALKAVVGVVVALGIVAGVFVWQRPVAISNEASSEAAAVEATPEPAPVTVTPAVNTDSEATPASPQLSQPAMQPGTCTLVCEAVMADGTPVPGAVISVRSSFDVYANGVGVMPAQRTATANAKGVAVFSGLSQQRFIVLAEGEAGSAHLWADTWAYRYHRVVLEPDTRFYGRVVDGDERPVRDAWISVVGAREDKRARHQLYANGPVAVTGSDGAFTTRLPHGQSFQVLVQAPGYATITTAILEGVANEFILRPGRKMTGTLHHQAGRPAEGVVLVAIAEDEKLDQQRAVVDALGKFIFTGLRPTEYSVYPQDENLVLTEPDVQFSPGSPDTVSLHCEPGAVIAGRVVERTRDEGIPGATVNLSYMLGAHDYTRRVRSDDAGAFRFEGVSTGPKRVSVSHVNGYEVDFEIQSQEVEAIAGETIDDIGFPHQGQWPGVSTIRGRVTRAGKAAAGVTVSAGLRAVQHSWTVSGADGRYALERVPMGRDVIVWAAAPGEGAKVPSFLALSADGLSGIDLELAPTGSIEGKIVDESGKPIDRPKTRIDLNQDWDARTRILGTLEVLEDGVFRLPELIAGRYALYVNFERAAVGMGWQEPDVTIEVEAGEALRDVKVVAQPPQQTPEEERRAMREMSAEHERKMAEQGWGIEGRVLDAKTGKPLDSYQMKVRGMGSSRRENRADDGRFTVEPRIVAYRSVEILAEGYAPQLEVYYPEDAVDGTVDTIIRLERGAAVEGVVRNAEGTRLEGATVYAGELMDVRPNSGLSITHTNADGTFRLTALPQGPQLIYVEHPSYAIANVDIAPAVGTVTNTEITLTHGASIEGTVINEGVPLVDARVGYFAEPSGRRQFSVRTDAQGRFRVENVMPGDVKVNAWMPRGKGVRDSQWQNTVVAVAEGEVGRVDFDFRKRSSRIEGVVTYLGEPIRHPQVSVGMTTGDVSEQFAVTVAEGGFYRTQDLPPGEATLRVRGFLMREGSLSRTIPITVGANSVITYDVDFSGTGTVTGTLDGLRMSEAVTMKLLAGNLPIPADLEENQADNPVSVGNPHHEDGRFVMRGVEPGTYTLRAVSGLSHAFSDAPIRVVQEVVTVAEGESVEITLHMEP